MFRFHSTCANELRRQLFCLLAMATSSVAWGAEPEAKTWHYDWRSARQASREEERPILLYITSKCCFYCEKMRHDTYGNSQVVDDIYHNYVPVSIDSKHHPELVEHLGVRRFPTTFIVGRDNRVVDSISGYVGPEQMRSWLNTSAAKTAPSTIARR